MVVHQAWTDSWSGLNRRFRFGVNALVLRLSFSHFLGGLNLEAGLQVVLVGVRAKLRIFSHRALRKVLSILARLDRLPLHRIECVQLRDGNLVPRLRSRSVVALRLAGRAGLQIERVGHLRTRHLNEVRVLRYGRRILRLGEVLLLVERRHSSAGHGNKVVLEAVSETLRVVEMLVRSFFDGRVLL